MKAKDIIKGCGIAPNIRGYQYLITAIELGYENEEYIDKLTKMLYPEVAKIHNSTPSAAERCMRHAIEKIYENQACEFPEIINFRGNPYKGKATNGEFIALCVNILKEQPRPIEPIKIKKRLGDMTANQLINICKEYKEAVCENKNSESCPLYLSDEGCVLEYAPEEWNKDFEIEILKDRIG